jgi:hypothetical protein
MNSLESFEREISTWTGISVHSHRFGGKEFRFGNAEVGHVHTGGTVDIPFTRSIRNALLQRGLAEEHHFVPNSGWITYRMRGEAGLRHALWLMRLSYLRYALKHSPDPIELFTRESDQLRLEDEFASLLRQFIPANEHKSSVGVS